MSRWRKRQTPVAGACRCTDDAFLADLGLPCRSRQAALALAVRAVIAVTIEATPASLCAHHTFADDLAGWAVAVDSLDTVQLLMELEEQLDCQIPDAIAEKLPGVLELEFPHPLYTVADLVLPMTVYLDKLAMPGC